MVSCGKGHGGQARGAVSGPLGSASLAAVESKFLILFFIEGFFVMPFEKNMPLIYPSPIQRRETLIVGQRRFYLVLAYVHLSNPL